jgi:aryl-alcohol dehydrogenase-like predicted oxidoreductase
VTAAVKFPRDAWDDARARTLLGTDHIDVFILHRDDLAFTISAWADALLAELDANRDRRDRAADLAERLGTSPQAIALAYVMHQPAHVRPVVGTRSEAHLDEALAAAEIRLDADELAWLESG